MNRNIYRLVRSQTGLWVPAPEHTRSNGKGGKARKALLAATAAVSLLSANAFAVEYQGLPNLCSVCGGAKAFVEYGLAQYGVNGNVGTISQVGDKAILNWQNFNIAPGNQVVFQRVADLLNLKAIDGASFSTLNRIWDENPSVIAGQIHTVANQQANLMFINQNGILFANGTQVNASQFTASALNISNNDFINNKYAPVVGSEVTSPVFRYGMDGKTDNYSGFVKVLEGAKITSDVGGRVMLIAPTVTNRGDISTPGGQAILAAGSQVYLQTSSVPSLRGLLVQVDNASLGDGDSENKSNEKLLKRDLSAYKLTKDKTIEGSITAKQDTYGVQHVAATETAAYVKDSVEVLRDALGAPLIDDKGNIIPVHKAGDIVHAGDQVAVGDSVRVFAADYNVTVTENSKLVTPAMYLQDSSEVLRAANGTPVLDANGNFVPVHKKGDMLQAGETVFAGDKITEFHSVADNYDKLGSATNADVVSVNELAGSLTASKGNITMVGMAVNQMGRATATSAYNYNGSIYLHAITDPSAVTGAGIIEKRAGRVILGSGSKTEVGIDTSDTTKTTVAITPSKVDVIGTDIQVKSNAKVIVPAGIVNFSALSDPSKLLELNPKSTDDPFASAIKADPTASRVIFESGSLVDVSGVNATELQKDNVLEIKLLGAELADSPINRETLRGKTVYVDVNKGSSLIANLSEYQANIAKTLEQRSTSAGSVRVQSTGQTIVQPNATFDLSGGVTTYIGGSVPTTSLIGADGRIYDISQATPDVKFVGLTNEFTVNEGWGQTGVFSRKQMIDSLGYVHGGDAGLFLLNARTAYLNGNILGSTTAGINQLQYGQLPLSATFMLGFNKGAEFGVNQNVLIDGKIAALSADNTLTEDQASNLHLSSAMFGQNKIGRLEVNTNQNVTVNQSLKMADGGSVNINAAKVNVNADISTTKANVTLNKATDAKALPVVASTKDDAMNLDVQTKSGAININATNNLFNNVADATTGVVVNKPELRIADGVKLSSTGFWINEQADLLAANNVARLIDGGSISLTAAYYDDNSNLINSTVQLGAGSILDVRGGAYRNFSGINSYGKGGDISLYATDVASTDALQNHFKGESFGTAGKLSVTSDRVLVGAQSPTALSIDGGFFNQGFGSYSLTGLSGLEVADNANIKVQTNNLVLSQNAATNSNATNADSVGNKVLLDVALRKSADLSLKATSRGKLLDSSGSVAISGVLSDLKIGKGAQITTDIGANVNVLATNSVDIDGTINAPAGNITVSLHNGQNSVNEAQRIHLGENAVLAAVGAAKLIKDSKGLNQGAVLSGGKVSLQADDGYVDTEKTALIDVHGASPVEINIANVNGGQGQFFGSNAGSVDIQGLNGLYLDNSFNAKAGSSANRGGTVSIGLGATDTSATPGLVMHIGQFDTVSPASNNLRTDSQIKQGYVDPSKLQNAGFETINLSSRDTMQFDQGGNFGATQPLYSVQLNASNIVATFNGDSTINAKLVALGNTDITRQSAANTPAAGNAKLNVNAEYIALNGNASYSGFSDINLNSTGEVRLIGVQPVSDIHGLGSLNTLGNINIAANLVDPSSLTTFDINTNGVGDVHFSFVPRASDILSYSAQGKIQVNAKNIVQSGRIVAPFGDVGLKADNSLTLEAGSVTSVAAASGQVIPFGYTLNGKTWFFDKTGDASANANATDNEVIDALVGKKVGLSGNQVNIKNGATLDISAAGDLQASQFTAGPGGSTDFLAQNGYYAILPSYNGTVAPTDVLRDDSANQPLVGSSVYLSGNKGLAAGNYVLLPAKYALLPGAFAIKVATGVSDVLPNNSYVKSDGVAVVGGFLSDQRFSASDINAARWTGFELLTKNQVLERADYTLTNASSFFASKDGSARTQDAGLLQVAVTQKLAINGSLKTNAANGGVGAGLDISADKLAVLSASAASSAQADEVVLDIDQLNNLNVDSLLLGATRNRVGTTTTLEVKTQQVRVDNVAGNGEAALKGREVMLAAKNDVLLQRNATIQATGSEGDAGTYKIDGDAAFVRAAATDAVLKHTGTTQATGNISGDVGTKVLASNSIMLDASNNNKFLGKLNGHGFGLPKNLLLSANRMNVGAAPAGVNGLNLTDDFLNALTDIQKLTLRSYSTFDFYGNANLGSSQLNATTGVRDYSVNNLSLEAADIRGYGDAGNIANIQAKTLTFANPNAVANGDAGTGGGEFNIQTEKMYLGVGTKSISGFSNANLTSAELLSTGKGGELKLSNDTKINTARMSGDSASSQKITNTANLSIDKIAAKLAALDTVGNSWTVEAKNLNVNTEIQSVSGDIALTAKGGDLMLGQDVILNASGKLYQFYDKNTPVDAGSITLKSDTGNIAANAGAQVNLDSAAGGNAGKLNVQAVNGQANMSEITLSGKNVAASNGVGKSGSVTIDAKSIDNFDQLNQQLNQAGFAEKRDFHMRTGDLNLTQAGTGTIKANEVSIAVDGGALSVDNTIDASGAKGGNITLYARDDVKLTSNANLKASATSSGEKGGTVEIGTRAGSLDLQSGFINVADSQGGNSGEVLLRTPRTDTSVNIKSLNTVIQGASSVSLEGVKTYNNISTLNSAATSNGSQLSINTILADNTIFMNNKTSILSGLGGQVTTLGSKFHLIGGAEVRSSGNLTVASDLNLYQAARPGGEAGVLSLLANGDLIVNGSISDGFETAATTSAIDANGQNSWSYRLVAGADQSAANPMSLAQAKTDADGSKKGDFNLATGKLIRTGTGDIDIAAAGDFNLASQTSVIYTAGRVADSITGFNYLTTTGNNAANAKASSFTQNGGDIAITVAGDVSGAVTDQLYSSWLYRQGKVNADGNFDATNPQTAWWVQFSQFQQGVATLGGGDVSVNAGGNVNNLSVSSATNGRMAATTPTEDKLVVLGGGNVNVIAGGDVVAGEYYAGKGKLNIDTEGGLVEGVAKSGGQLYTTIALGDAQASIKANDDIHIEAVINPTMVVQSSTSVRSSLTGNVFGTGSSDIKQSTFSTYTDKTAIGYESLNGNIDLHNDIEGLKAEYNASNLQWVTSNNYKSEALYVAPGGLKAYAYNGDINVLNRMSLYPSSQGAFELLAKENVTINGSIIQSDAPLSVLSDARAVVRQFGAQVINTILSSDSTHASTPVHQNDKEVARIYALEGDIQGSDDTNIKVSLAKSAKIIAGNDYKNLGFTGQNLSESDVTSIKAGRDIVFDTSATQGVNGLNLGGQGLFEFEAGRNMDLGASKGISSLGNTENNSLPVQGANINIAVGVPNGVDYEGAINRLMSAISSAKAAGVNVDDNTLWQARWLTGNKTLANNPTALLSAVDAIKSQGDASIRQHVRDMFYTALRDTGRDYNSADSDYAGQYTRGYSAIELLFPNISQKNLDGSSKYYAGDLSLPLTTIKTRSGGDIEFMVPGGQALVGYTSIFDGVLDVYDKGRKITDTGIVAVSTGSVRGFTRDDILVNQSRILTVAGGDILLWSSEGNIDAGKGKRTALVVPPPLIYPDANGKIVVSLQGAAVGSGIGALGDENTAGSVDLIAPTGTVDAGDAGIRAKNVNIAAQTVLNAGNITVSGTATGTQVAVAGALNGALTGAAGAGDPSKAINDAVNKSIQTSAEPFKKPPSPSFINVEVVSIGD